MYVEQMYEHWKKDPQSVHVSWDSFFRNVDSGMGPGIAFQKPGASPPAGVSSDTKSIEDTSKSTGSYSSLSGIFLYCISAIGQQIA